MLTRRASLFGFLAAPIIIRTPGLLMPIKPLRPETPHLDRLIAHLQSELDHVRDMLHRHAQIVRPSWQPRLSLASPVDESSPFHQRMRQNADKLVGDLRKLARLDQATRLGADHALARMCHPPMCGHDFHNNFLLDQSR